MSINTRKFADKRTTDGKAKIAFQTYCLQNEIRALANIYALVLCLLKLYFCWWCSLKKRRQAVMLTKREGVLSSPGNFCACLNETKTEISVPEDVFSFCCQVSVKTVEEFLSLADAFPTSFCTVLRWTHEQLKQALKEFKELVSKNDLVDEIFLNPPQPERRNYGAMPPPGIEWQIGKTVESIRFVKDAQEFIRTSGDISGIRILWETIFKIRLGEEIITLAQTPQEYLIAYRQRHKLI